MNNCLAAKTNVELQNARNALASLAQVRRGYPLVPGFDHIEQFHNGVYATQDFVVPWTKSACNLDASVMLVLQDWNSAGVLAALPIDQHQVITGQSKGFPTNTRIRKLLRAYFNMSFCQTYATDVIPFAKHGNRRAPVPFSFMAQCASAFTLNEIAVVRPCIVLAIGIKVYQAIYMAHSGNMPSAASQWFDIVHSNGCVSRVYCLSHPQRHLKADERAVEWSRAAAYYDSGCKKKKASYPREEGPNIHSQQHYETTEGLSNGITCTKSRCMLWQLGTCRSEC
jgi:hypothetical protein